ncbi:MAG: hypothetical protein WBX11_14400 [Thiobacillaceae bacterium]
MGCEGRVKPSEIGHFIDPRCQRIGRLLDSQTAFDPDTSYICIVLAGYGAKGFKKTTIRQN